MALAAFSDYELPQLVQASSRAQRFHISAALGIHQGLCILFPTEQLGVEWLRTPHNAVVFGGQPPLDLVTSGSQDGLLLVRRFLDGARGGLYMQPTTIDEAFTPTPIPSASREMSG